MQEILTSPLVGEVGQRPGEGYDGAIWMLEKFKKSLRTNQTDVEARLWYQLRNRRFQGLKFRRQHVLQNYIVDFVCLELKLIIELDGGQHVDQKNYDDQRTMALEKEGYNVLRFWNNDVLNNIDGVLEMILRISRRLAK